MSSSILTQPRHQALASLVSDQRWTLERHLTLNHLFVDGATPLAPIETLASQSRETYEKFLSTKETLCDFAVLCIRELWDRYLQGLGFERISAVKLFHMVDQVFASEILGVEPVMNHKHALTLVSIVTTVYRISVEQSEREKSLFKNVFRRRGMDDDNDADAEEESEDDDLEQARATGSGSKHQNAPARREYRSSRHSKAHWGASSHAFGSLNRRHERLRLVLPVMPTIPEDTDLGILDRSQAHRLDVQQAVIASHNQFEILADLNAEEQDQLEDELKINTGGVGPISGDNNPLATEAMASNTRNEEIEAGIRHELDSFHSPNASFLGRACGVTSSSNHPDVTASRSQEHGATLYTSPAFSSLSRRSARQHRQAPWRRDGGVSNVGQEAKEPAGRTEKTGDDEDLEADDINGLRRSGRKCGREFGWDDRAPDRNPKTLKDWRRT